MARRLGKALALILWLAVPAQAGDEAAPVTVLALGDSLTQGYGLPQEDGLVPQLRRWLAERATSRRESSMAACRAIPRRAGPRGWDGA